VVAVARGFSSFGFIAGFDDFCNINCYSQFLKMLKLKMDSGRRSDGPHRLRFLDRLVGQDKIFFLKEFLNLL